MTNYADRTKPDEQTYQAESLRLEAITACVGFDDLLDATLARNMAHFDTMIVVTSHDDYRTQEVARKHGATVVVTDLFKKDGRGFNKGAALNAGLGRFRYHGWRLHIDSDIALPDSYRRILFNHHALDRTCLYGADRVDIIGLKSLEEIYKTPQHRWHNLVTLYGQMGSRFVDSLRGYIPLGFHQLWHSSERCEYPYSIGDAAHDDVMFADRWPESRRRLLPGVVLYHLCARPPQMGENWDGVRRQPRLN